MKGFYSMKKLSAGELAKKAQIGFETIRYYEKRGILPRPNKSPSGYREYSEESIAQVMLIKKMKKLGFTLLEIKRLFLEENSYQKECPTVERKLKVKMGEIEKKISELQGIKTGLNKILKTCQKNMEKESCPLLHESKTLEN